MSAGYAAGGAELRRILPAALAICAILPIGYVVRLLWFEQALFPDFFGLWSFGRFLAAHPATAIYDPASVHGFQIALGMPDDFAYSFLYPPWLLLLLAPFGALPYPVARVAWLALTFAAYVAALRAWRWDWRCAALLALAPSTAVCALAGQNGFLSGALMLGGLRLLPARPWLAGALLGTMAYKPQLAFLIPPFLLFGGHWRALAGAALAAFALSVASTAAFGPGIWAAWLDFLRGQGATLAAGRDTLLDLMPTLTATLRLLGAGATLAHLAQAAGALAALAALWATRRRPDMATLPLATFLATPYGFHYDLPLATGGALALLAARLEGGGVGQGELAALLACVVLPALLPAHLGPSGALVVAAIAAALWLAASPRPARIAT